MNKLVSIISFCTHDIRFLDKCLSAVKPFSDQIIIPVCDHFYNGEKEDIALLEQVYQKYLEVDFVEFAYSKEEVYGTPSRLIPGSPGWAQHWHNSARLVGTFFIKSEIDCVLFLDVDEIFSEDIRQVPFWDYAAIRFATYWYFKTAHNCASVTPNGPLLVKRNLLTTHLLLDEDERMGIFNKIEGKKEQEFLVENRPIVHHYSWVRTKEEMRKKTKRWGHHWERDWAVLIKEKRDFVRNYSYRKVEPFWDPLKEQIHLPKAKGPFTNVQKVTPKKIFRMEITQQL